MRQRKTCYTSSFPGSSNHTTCRVNFYFYFLLAFVFLYVIYDKPSSPCKIKFPEMYSLIFLQRNPPFFFTTNHHISERRASSHCSHMLSNKSTLCDWPSSQQPSFFLFLCIIKKGDSVNTSGLGWTEALGNVIYKQEVGVRRGHGGGIGETPMWW